MIRAVADTHALIWYIYSDERLSDRAKFFLDSVLEDRGQIAVSAITLIEMAYLIEKGRIASESFSRVARTLADPASGLVEIPINLATARALTQVSAEQIPDMPDRIVAASALQYQVPIISRDARIVHSDLETIW